MIIKKNSGIYLHFCNNNPNAFIKEPESFKLKLGITGKTSSYDKTEDYEIVAPFKYLSNYWRALEISLINLETTLILTWSKNHVMKNLIDSVTLPTTSIKHFF